MTLAKLTAAFIVVLLTSPAAAAADKSAPGEHHASRELAPACRPCAVRRTQAAFGKAYAAKDFAKARKLLEPLLQRCEEQLGRQSAGFIRNDLALTLHHLGDGAGCERALQPLEALAKQSDDQISAGVAPADREEELRLARTTRTSLKLCTAPKLEDNLPALVGRTFVGAEQLDPALSSGVGGVIADEYGIGNYNKAAWAATPKSRGKTMWLFTQFVGREGGNPIEKILDVVLIDFDRFPAGARSGMDDPGCQAESMPKAEIVAVYPTKNADRGVVPYRAWYPDIKTGKLVELPPGSVRCTISDDD